MSLVKIKSVKTISYAIVETTIGTFRVSSEGYAEFDKENQYGAYEYVNIDQEYDRLEIDLSYDDYMKIKLAGAHHCIASQGD